MSLAVWGLEATEMKGMLLLRVTFYEYRKTFSCVFVDLRCGINQASTELATRGFNDVVSNVGGTV